MVARRPNAGWRVVLLAAVLALAPAIGLNLLLWFHISVHGEDNIRDSADGILRLAEEHLDDAMTQLVGLGINSAAQCDPASVALLQRAMLSTPYTSEIAVLGTDGKPRCAANGRPRVLRQVSPENDTANPHIKLSVVDFGADNGPRMVRLVWRYPDGSGFSALVPGERLIPPVVIGRLQANFLAKILLVDGTYISSRLSNPGMSVGSNAFELRRLSDRYPFAVSISVPYSALWQSYRELFLYGNAGSLVLAALILLGAWGVSRLWQGPERDIAQALRRGDFIPYYQPVIDLQSGRLMGCEVLVRRRRSNGSVESPGSFIALVEATGQIFDITRALMIHARDELADCYQDRPHLKVSFNLVAGHFADLDIVRQVREIFSEGAVRPQQIVLEVTERQPLPNLKLARVIISKLQDFGVRVAVDDVGTGHGGFSYLLKLGADQMKMDKMFVDAIGTDRCSAAIIDTMVNLAESLSMELIAEGVETFEQAQYLRERGVSGAQGYVFAPPLPGASFKALIAAMDRAPATAPAKASDSAEVDTMAAGAA